METQQFVELSPNDIEPCARLYVATFNAPPWNENWNIKGALERIQFLMGIPTSLGFKLIQNQEIVGFWIGYIRVGFDELHIEEVVVHPNHQKKGLGKKLVSSVEETASKKALKKITLCTLVDSYIEKFYGGLGFTKAIITFMEKPSRGSKS